jgi:hypothetical protein
MIIIASTYMQVKAIDDIFPVWVYMTDEDNNYLMTGLIF